jgi:uncharacterized protein YegL
MSAINYLSASMQAYTGTIPVFPEGDESQNTFYVLNLVSANMEKVPYTWDVKFSIDHSASMNDQCADGRTKMQHIKHVIINILRIFVSESYDNMMINVCVHIFDDQDTQLFDFVRVTKTNVDELIAKIETAYPNNSTDLLKPFQITNRQMAEREALYPQSRRLHFMLTDGIDTCNNSTQTIVESVSSDYSSVVFGFGMDHDYETFMKIGSKLNVEYAFIDDIEKAGFVYGEYLHKLFYVCVENIVLEIENGQIYDWKKNVWSNQIIIDSMASDLTKTYYTRSTMPNDVVCNVHGRICDAQQQNPQVQLDRVVAFTSIFPSTLLMDRHVYRYRTLQLLYESHNQPKNYEMKEKMKTYFNEMKQFMKDNDFINDTLMKGLLDDMYMVYKSYGSRHSQFYSSLRQRSQGRQNVYTVITPMSTKRSVPPPLTPRNNHGPPSLQRSGTISMCMSDDEKSQFDQSFDNVPTNWHMVSDIHDDIIDQHELTQIHDEYSSPAVLQLMREASRSNKTESCDELLESPC